MSYIYHDAFLEVPKNNEKVLAWIVPTGKSNIDAFWVNAVFEGKGKWYIAFWEDDEYTVEFWTELPEKPVRKSK